MEPRRSALDSVDIKIDSFFFEISIPHHHRYLFPYGFGFCFPIMLDLAEGEL